jgi:hypothetical protein
MREDLEAVQTGSYRKGGVTTEMQCKNNISGVNSDFEGLRKARCEALFSLFAGFVDFLVLVVPANEGIREGSRPTSSIWLEFQARELCFKKGNGESSTQRFLNASSVCNGRPPPPFTLSMRRKAALERNW